MSNHGVKLSFSNVALSYANNNIPSVALFYLPQLLLQENRQVLWQNGMAESVVREHLDGLIDQLTAQEHPTATLWRGQTQLWVCCLHS